MEIEKEHLFHDALASGINLFLGAGFSVLAKNKRSEDLPIGEALRDQIIKYFNRPDFSGLPLAKISTILNKSQRVEFAYYLIEKFSIGEYDQRYKILDKVNAKGIFTTNVDDLIEEVFSVSDRKYINDLDVRGHSDLSRVAIDLVHLHGSILRPESPMYFGALEIASAFHSDTDRWHFLTKLIQDYPTLFWGNQLDDPGTLEALNPRTIHGRTSQSKWIMLLPGAKPGDIEYYRAMDFNIIISDTASLLDHLASWQQKEESSKSEIRVNTASLFPQESIPNPGVVPVRPITNFYLGAPPNWADIYSDNIHRTKYCEVIEDSIFSGRHTIVVGLPACGKTTLMMQVAAGVKFKGHKLVLDSPSDEQAEFIIRRLSNDNALLFIDNFSDCITSFDRLSQISNIKLVGFDREYNFGIISHKITRKLFNIFDVSNISSEDIQAILERFPPNLKRSSPRQIERKRGTVPTIYDIVEAHIIKHNLRERYRSAIDELYKTNEQLAELLVCCCYVHRCRTPVSFDMLFAFLREHINSYEDIYHLCDRLGALITEYYGQYADQLQDYYSPRSTIIAEAIIDQTPSALLRTVITKFHEHISPTRICRFDIFRKSAYDANLMKKAFMDWTEGKEFYEYVYERDQSPYLLQQGALYLASKNRYDEAFSWIDRAIVLSRGRIYSIRNSHAILLFRANINRQSDDPTVKQTLGESMEILTECYNGGSQKVYHAQIFAEQAIQYWDIYGDDQARDYINQGHAWLTNCIKQEQWNRKLKHLSRQLEERIRQAN